MLCAYETVSASSPQSDNNSIWQYLAPHPSQFTTSRLPLWPAQSLLSAPRQSRSCTLTLLSIAIILGVAPVYVPLAQPPRALHFTLFQDVTSV